MQVCSPQDIRQAHSQNPPNSRVSLEKPLSLTWLRTQSFYIRHYHYFELPKPFPVVKYFQCKLSCCHLWVWISTFQLTSNVPCFLAFYCHSTSIVGSVNLNRIWFEYYCCLLIRTTDIQRELFLKSPNLLAWADKLGRKSMGHLGHFLPI